MFPLPTLVGIACIAGTFARCLHFLQHNAKMSITEKEIGGGKIIKHDKKWPKFFGYLANNLATVNACRQACARPQYQFPGYYFTFNISHFIKRKQLEVFFLLWWKPI
jgi:hypothetical protein